MVWFYIALYPVRWTAQRALHSPPLADLFIPTPFSASLGSILAMQQLRNDYSLTFPPLSIARYSFIQLSRLRRREMKENAQTSKRYQRGFEPGLSRLRVRHSTNWATALHNGMRASKASRCACALGGSRFWLVESTLFGDHVSLRLHWEFSQKFNLLN